MAKGRTEINIDKCKGCGLCINACPRGVLAMSKSTNGQGVYYPVAEKPEECIGCTMCALMCPDSIIEVYKEKAKG